MEPAEKPLVVEDPVEDRVREDGVDRLVDLQVGQLGLDDLGVRVRAERLARVLDHRRCLVHRQHAAAWQPLEQHQRRAARAATGVENRLVAAQVEPV